MSTSDETDVMSEEQMAAAFGPEFKAKWGMVALGDSIWAKDSKVWRRLQGAPMRTDGRAKVTLR